MNLAIGFHEPIYCVWQFFVANWFPFSTFAAALMALGSFRTRQSVIQDDVQELKRAQTENLEKFAVDLSAVKEDVAFIRGTLEGRRRFKGQNR